VVAFTTEAGYDKLTVGRTQYSGTVGPQGVIVVEADVISWSSDSSVVRSGWKICLGPGGATVTTSTTTAPPTTSTITTTAPAIGGTAWSMASGACSVVGNCVASPNFPSNYGNSQQCNFNALRSGTILVESFNTETGYDKVTVKGVSYSGAAGPQGVAVNTTDVITWASDSSITKPGWKLCLQ